MNKTAIIRYKSSLNDKYVTWNICFESQDWGITETVTLGDSVAYKQIVFFNPTRRETRPAW